MTRSAEFSHTVKHGVRVAQPDLVVHVCRSGDVTYPRVGFIVAKSVGNAVDRHRVTRRLRHVLRDMTSPLEQGERVVVRALPGSREASSDELRGQLTAGLRRAHRAMNRGVR